MSYPIIGDSTVLHSPPAKNKRGPVAQLGARTVRIRKVEGSIPFGSTKMNDPTQFEQTLVVVQNGWGHFMPELLALQGVQAFLYFMSCVT